MPVVTLYFDRIGKLLGRKISREKILSTLPFLGLDIEEETQDHVNVEYSPNRPDFSTDYGIVAGLQGLLGIKLGMTKLEIKKGKDVIKADSSIRKVRSFIIAIEARNGTLDDETIRQIITMQEDLHNGIGRKRKKTSIGIHDLDKIRFPLIYNTALKTHRFIPLGSQREMAISEILENTETGITYKHLLDGHQKIPVIIDSTGNVISLPPIINSRLTEVTKLSKNLLVEVTATDKTAAEDTLAVVAYILQNAGFALHSVRISGANNTMPSLAAREILLDPTLVNETLGLSVTQSVIVKSLRKSRLDAKTKGKKILCIVPRYRTDIFSSVDLVEEIALGYGIQNLVPMMPYSSSAGQKNKITTILEAVRSTMVGLGYSEVMNQGLVSKHIEYDLVNRDASKIISVADSKSIEHQILRDMLVPGLIDVLSRNIHESYPQKIFEIGTIFNGDNQINEEIHLGCLSAHKETSFTEIKSILQSFFKSGFNMTIETKTFEDSLYSHGRTASVFVNNKKIGSIGEISTNIIDNFKLRTPVAGFEINLTGLIFD